MLADIETKIVERIKAKVTQPRDVDIHKAHSALITPAVFVVIGNGRFSKVAQKIKLEASVYITVEFKNMKGEEERRKGIYPIFEAIVACLIFQNLGLSIDPLVPVNFQNITEEEEAKAGKILFQAEFKTGFIIDEVSDEVVTDLLKVGLNYYLKPGDDVSDSSDTVTLGG